MKTLLVIILSLFACGMANSFQLGDVNLDGSVNIGDAVFLINYIFKGGSAPESIDKLMVLHITCITDTLYLYHLSPHSFIPESIGYPMKRCDSMWFPITNQYRFDKWVRW